MHGETVKSDYQVGDVIIRIKIVGIWNKGAQSKRLIPYNFFPRQEGN